MVLNKDMLVVAAGNNLIESWSVSNENKHPNMLIGSPFMNYFFLRRPTDIVFDFENVKNVSSNHTVVQTPLINHSRLSQVTTMQAVLFEIQLKVAANTSSVAESSKDETKRRNSSGLRGILLKGEMRYLKDVKMLVFLCSPL